jgi:hypothetical protein
MPGNIFRERTIREAVSALPREIAASIGTATGSPEAKT